MDNVPTMRGPLPLHRDGAYHTPLVPIARLPHASTMFRMGP